MWSLFSLSNLQLSLALIYDIYKVNLTCFTKQYEDGEVNESLEVGTEKLQDDMIRNNQQKKITDYLTKKINWYMTKKITSFSPFHIPIVK